MGRRSAVISDPLEKQRKKTTHRRREKRKVMDKADKVQ